ncbi:MAG: GNAT family N-acetyltransferase [Bacteroidota bacterium]
MDNTVAQLITQEGDFKIWIRQDVPPEIVDFLRSVLMGTEGAMYEHLDVEKRIAHIKSPYLAYATKEDSLVACMLMSRVESLQKAIPLDSYYIRYFSAHPDFKGQGITKRLSAVFIRAFQAQLPENTLLYAAMEGGNKRSISIVEKVGFTSKKPVQTFGFSRFFPKGNPKIEQLLNPGDRAVMLDLLSQFYQNYTIHHHQNIFQNDQYYVIRENGKIVAGLQMHRTVWRIRGMPGWKGKVLLNVVPKIPVLNKMMNPNWFEFITFEGIYYQPGKEAKLFSLMEGLLAQEKLKTAIFWLAGDSPVSSMLRKKAKLGIIHALVKDSVTYMTFNGKGLQPEVEKILKECPPYISSFDFI